jgi:hypothetical protein
VLTGKIVELLTGDYYQDEYHSTEDAVLVETMYSRCVKIECNEHGRTVIHTSDVTTTTSCANPWKPRAETLVRLFQFLHSTRQWRLINTCEDERMDTFLFGERTKKFYLYSLDDYCVHGTEFLAPSDAGPFPPSHWKVSRAWMHDVHNEFVVYFRKAITQGMYRIVYWG